MRILFVCSGNTCRSPLAAGIFNVLAERENLPVYAESCGIMAFPSRASELSIEIAAEYGADISMHTARQVNEEIMQVAKYVFCMTESQCLALRAAFPKYQDKIFTVADTDIADPYGGDRSAYERTGKELYNALKTLIGKLKERMDDIDD